MENINKSFLREWLFVTALLFISGVIVVFIQTDKPIVDFACNMKPKYLMLSLAKFGVGSIILVLATRLLNRMFPTIFKIQKVEETVVSFFNVLSNLLLFIVFLIFVVSISTGELTTLC